MEVRKLWTSPVWGEGCYAARLHDKLTLFTFADDTDGTETGPPVTWPESAEGAAPLLAALGAPPTEPRPPGGDTPTEGRPEGDTALTTTPDMCSVGGGREVSWERMHFGKSYENIL